MVSRKRKTSSEFPPAGIDIVEHELTVDMLQVSEKGKKKKLLESLVFKGRMTLQRSNPYRVARGKDAGKSKIEFDVLTWVASAFSQKLQTEILYVLSEDVKQKPSMIIAEQPNRDFPAEFIFNVTFDARANNKTIRRRHHGRPHGTGFRTVPPDGNRRNSPTITGFEDNFIQLKHPTYGTIRFVPRHCNDNEGKTVVALSPTA
jgi:hypothetical protein